MVLSRILLNSPRLPLYGAGLCVLVILTLFAAQNPYWWIAGAFLTPVMLICLGVWSLLLRGAFGRTPAIHGPFPRLRRFRRACRVMGFWFLLVGSILLGRGLGLLLDPAATITCNGIVTASTECKTSFTLGALAFAVVGAVFASVPRRRLRQLAVWAGSTRLVFWRSMRYKRAA